ITLNNPAKIGYAFTGWSGTGLTGEDNMTVTIPKGSTGDRTYTAHYTEKGGYSVAFDVGGGSDVSSKTDVKWTDKVLDGVGTPTKAGYTFVGWKCGETEITANTTYSELAGSDTVLEIMLTAQWEDANVKYGDLNDDGKINLFDLIAMRKYLANWSIEVNTAAADCNADGKINLFDLILMRKYLANWSVVLGPQA
ncbi:MAG: dockerin type I domain-containing protein, partial [Acutalibacteraceae bacterium]